MKKCKEKGCVYFVFGGGYCINHQYRRTDMSVCGQNRLSSKKRPTTQPKKDSAFKTSKQQLKESFGFTSQLEMFHSIWKERKHVCWLTGADLNDVPKRQWHWMFAHCLPKGLYPFWKLNPENVFLLHPDVHTMVDNFTPNLKNRFAIDFDRWFELQDEMKQKYNQFLKDNMF